jgi:hypothetical protein
MTPDTLKPADAVPDADMAEQAHPGYGIPSQDPRAGAQDPLEPAEAAREAQSVYTAGGVMAGATTGAVVGTVLAGPVGVVVGGVIGAIAGAVGAGAVGGAEKTKPESEAGASGPPIA